MFQLSPVIVDFGKTDVFGKANNAVPIKGHYKNNCVAPKLVDRTGRPSVVLECLANTSCHQGASNLGLNHLCRLAVCH